MTADAMFEPAAAPSPNDVVDVKMPLSPGRGWRMIGERTDR